MTPRPIAVDPKDYTAPLDVVGIRITVLSSKEQTDGSHEVTLQEGPEGSGPPPHTHGWDESFYVLRGSVDYMVDGQPVHATVGTFLHLPAGTVHAFQFGPGGGAMLEIAGAGGQATAMFRRLDGVAIDPSRPDFPQVVGTLGDYGVQLAV
jgi:quercetin dioxygenase-like cupin family protein